MVLFLAAMQNIPPQLYDAAKIDGANRMQEFWHITVPGILPTLALMLLMVGIWSFLVFDYVWLLTQGGPAGSSEVMATYLYKQAFNRFEAGYASAIGLTMSLFAGVIISIFIYLKAQVGYLITMFKNQRAINLLPNYLILILLVAFAIGPLAVLGFNSVKDNTEIGANPLGPPSELHFENYPEAWEKGKFATTVMNSVWLVIFTVLAELIFGGMAAYSLARLDPPGHNLFMVYMLIGSTLPIWLFLVPLFSLWRILGLINSLFGLILLYTAFNAPFSIFLLRSFMLQVPRDFDEAAKVDGASTFQIFTRVLLPLNLARFPHRGTDCWVRCME